MWWLLLLQVLSSHLFIRMILRIEDALSGIHVTNGNSTRNKSALIGALIIFFTDIPIRDIHNVEEVE